jgi:hypothetical protein
MYRNLRPIFELTADDFVDEDQLRVDRDARVEIMDHEIRDLIQRIGDRGEEDRELVRGFFRDMLASEPLWLVPGLLQFVASKADLTELQISRRIAGTIPIDDLPY